MTDSENENCEENDIKANSAKELDPIKLSVDPIISNPELFGFGNMIKNFWSKYICKGKDGSKSELGQDVIGHKIFDDYPDFNSEVNLIKDLNQSNNLEPESEFDFEMELDGLEKL